MSSRCRCPLIGQELKNMQNASYLILVNHDEPLMHKIALTKEKGYQRLRLSEEAYSIIFLQ